jgi:hypothetical protein
MLWALRKKFDSHPPSRHRASLPRPEGHCWPISWRASAPSAPRNGVDVGYRRLRGTAALQASTEPRCYGRMAIAGRSLGGRPLRRRRETVLLSATGGCEGPQPSKPPPSIVATAGGPLLADLLEGVRSVGAAK